MFKKIYLLGTLFIFFLCCAANSLQAKSIADYQKELLEKYDVAIDDLRIYLPSMDEREDSNAVFQLAVRRKLSAARREYLKLMKRYPKSPQVAYDYIVYLINNRRYSTALSTAKSKAKEYPKYLGFHILRGSLIKRSKTRGGKNKAKIISEMDSKLAAWQQLIAPQKAQLSEENQQENSL